MGIGMALTEETVFDEREGKEKKSDLEKLREILSSYANKAAVFIKHLLEAVFKFSPK